VLVKYNSSGQAQWAKTVEAGTVADASFFSSVAVDISGNVYAAGSQEGILNYGNGVTATGTYSGSNVLLVKYHE
jgi:hypothetical protein